MADRVDDQLETEMALPMYLKVSRLETSYFYDIDDFDGYQVENIENFPGFSLSVEVDYVNLSSKFRSVSSSPSNYKRVITSVNHDAIDQISDTLIISAGIQ